MAALLDTGFLYAIADKDDDAHTPAVEVLRTLTDEELILPTLVLVEVTYLIQEKVSQSAMHSFVKELQSSPLQFEHIQRDDLARIHELLVKYADNELDFVDAAITTMAERLGITVILTVDQRHFRVIRPAYCDYFEILP